MGKLRHRQVTGLSQSHAIATRIPSAQIPALIPPGLSGSQADGDGQCGKAAGHPGTTSALWCPSCATPKTAPPGPAIIPQGKDERCERSPQNCPQHLTVTTRSVAAASTKSQPEALPACWWTEQLINKNNSSKDGRTRGLCARTSISSPGLCRSLLSPVFSSPLPSEQSPGTYHWV